MDNPIKYTDLFNEDVLKGVKTLEGELRALKKELEGLIRNVKDGANENNKRNKDINDMYEAYKKLKGSLNEVTEELFKLQKSGDQVIFTQKEMNKSVKVLNDVNRDGADTYNNLTKQYQALKILINNMTTAERENTDAGKDLVQQAKDIYEQMNKLQQATGKHQLSVGNYSKALNGLNIATTQVIRELPVLTNGLAQFTIAIGNNIPILAQEIQQYAESQSALKKEIALMKEAGASMEDIAKKEEGLMSVGKALWKTVWSWQTLLVVVLSVLPTVIRKINEKRKAQEALNDANLKGVKYEEALLEANKKTGSSYFANADKLRVMYQESQDVNRTMEERLEIGQMLVDHFPKEFEGYDKEDIVLGRAEQRYNSITEALLRQARAKAYLDKITELETKKLNDTLEIEKRREQLDKAEAEKKEAEAISKSAEGAIVVGGLETPSAQVTAGLQSETEVSKIRKNIKRINNEITTYSKAVEEADDSIKKIKDSLNSLDMSTWFDEDKVKGGVKGALEELKDYYWEWRKSIADIIIDEENKEIAVSDVAYEEKIANLKEELEERRKTGKLTVEQEKYLTEIMLNLETERQQKRTGIIRKFVDKLWKDIQGDISTATDDSLVGEVDFSVSGAYEEMLARQSRLVLESRNRLDEELREGSYMSAKEEGKIFQDLSKEKLRIEADLQKAILAMRLDTGEITKDQYDIEIANVETKLAKGIASFNRKRGGKKFSIWTLLFGEVTEDGKGNVVKELTPEMQQFTSSIEKTFEMSFSYMQKWMDMRIEMAKIATESAQKEEDSAKHALEIEQEARANGYAHNVEFARKEYEEKRRIKEEALAEEKRLADIQQKIDEAQQISSLLVATANIWASYTKGNVLGAVLAGVATASMWGSFAAAKIQANQLVRTKTYGEGMSEYLDYGGSHASGNDIDFGTMKDGTRRRVERGEMVAVINKKNVNKYGVNGVRNVIDSLNDGTFDDHYGLAFAGLNAVQNGADLTELEQGMKTLVAQGEKKIVQNGSETIEYYKNRKRVIKS